MRAAEAGASPGTLARRLVKQLPRLGVQVVDLQPGTAVVSRRAARIEAFPLGRGLNVVVDSAITRRRRESPASFLSSLLDRLPMLGLTVTEAGFAAVVSAAGSRLKAQEVSPGVVVVTDPAVVRRHRHQQDKALSAYLLMQQILEVFARYQVNVVIDVGANKGQYARSLRRAGYKGRIASIEPVGREFEELSRRAANDPLWSVHRFALGREDGSLELNVVPGTLSSALPASEFGAERYEKLQHARVETVPLRRLGDVMDEILADVEDPRPYLKIDTQGFDLEVFGGLGDRAHDIVAMQSEVAFMQIYEGMPRMPESLAVYEGAGFEVAGFYPVTRERATARVLEFDCLMVRADSLVRDAAPDPVVPDATAAPAVSGAAG
jgi:FkbM family methyltransferase